MRKFQLDLYFVTKLEDDDATICQQSRLNILP